MFKKLHNPVLAAILIACFCSQSARGDEAVDLVREIQKEVAQADLPNASELDSKLEAIAQALEQRRSVASGIGDAEATVLDAIASVDVGKRPGTVIAPRLGIPGQANGRTESAAFVEALPTESIRSQLKNDKITKLSRLTDLDPLKRVGELRTAAQSAADAAAKSQSNDEQQSETGENAASDIATSEVAPIVDKAGAHKGTESNVSNDDRKLKAFVTRIQQSYESLNTATSGGKSDIRRMLLELIRLETDLGVAKIRQEINGEQSRELRELVETLRRQLLDIAKLK